MISAAWLLLSLAWLIYSYGFVDLNLTISSNPHWLAFLAPLQHLVYFDRPLSLQIFLALTILSFILYFVSMFYWSNSLIKKFPWKFLLIITVIFSLSYPMLSADSFKYLFAAKELLLYHANPHVVPPNAFPMDTWIRFMRWVHTPSPYGPVETLSVLPPYLLGLGKFVPALFLLKVQNLGFYLLAVWCLGKLKDTRAQLFFALNPLVLSEWLINAHNDAIMISLLLLSMVLVGQGKRLSAFLALLASVGIKFVTIIYLPFILIPKKVSVLRTAYCVLAALALAPLLYNYSSQYQPWYVTWLVPFAALTNKVWIKWSVAAYSLAVFSRYLAFVGTGFWETNPLALALSTFVLPVLVMLTSGSIWVIKKLWKKTE